MSIPTEILMAYVDGELAPEDREQVEAMIKSDPDVKSYVEQQSLLRRGMKEAFDGVLSAPVPQRLIAAVSRESWILRAWKTLTKQSRFVRFGVPAAALAMGVVIGIILGPWNDSQVTFLHGIPVARGALATALTEQLSGPPTGSAMTQIGLSFQDKHGHYCRTFEAARSLSGVACHEDGNWQIAILTRSQNEEELGSTYKPAASPMPDLVRRWVKNMIQRIPLDAAAERKAQAQGWNPR